MTASEKEESIRTALAALESGQGVRVLYACESGSRAWGFASQDSDWDVRFLYVRPLADYLRVSALPDTLQCDLPGELDLSGWDLRKALHHAAKSSASLLEWLHSPQVYRPGGAEVAELRALVTAAFRVKPVVDHYLGLARQLWQRAGEGEALNGKKCLYVLRATLAARWALTHGTPPPVAFAGMLPLVPDAALRGEIEEFVRLKQAGTEADAFPVSPFLRDWLQHEREACDSAAATLPVERQDLPALDAFFQKTVTGAVIQPA